MAKLSRVAMASLCCCVLLLAEQSAEAGYYDASVESTVRGLVEKAIAGNSSVGPQLIRLLFHDCWINGCDGSVLLDNATYSSSYGTEKNASSNIGLGGFELIDQIKSAVGADVSCADILAFAARDAASILSGGKISYDVAGGLKDGVNSSAAYADAALPGSTFSFAQLAANFAAKGMEKDLVALSGAHAIGVCHRSSFADRLDQPNTTLQIDPKYQTQLRLYIAKQNASNPTVKNNIRDMDGDFQTGSLYNATGVNATKGVLDNSYYTANLQKMVLLTSDWALTTDKNATADLQEYKNNATKWYQEFGAAMARLSKLLPPAGQYLEIRKNCRVTNANSY